jgi:hypothetical protein
MSAEQNYPSSVRVLSPAEVVARWRELGWGDAAAFGLTNDYGVPLHACHGVRQDEHYWAWVATWADGGRGIRPRLLGPDGKLAQ